MCINHPDRQVFARGLCGSCYQIIQKRIRDGKITDKVAVKSGKIMPRKKGWPGSNNPRRIKPFPQTS